jgi:hypothetical protein
MRIIDVFVGGTNVCPEDNNAYVPQFRESIQVDLSKLKQLHSTKYQEYFSDLTPEKAHRKFKRFHDVGEPVEWIDGDALHEHFRFLDWGPTTDDVQSFLIPSEGTAYLTYEFWRPEHPRSGRVEAVEIAIPELIETLADMLNKLAPE